jgi:hypothetical protein
VNIEWGSLKLAPPTQMRDLWTHRDEQSKGAVTVPAHGVVMWRVR